MRFAFSLAVAAAQVAALVEERKATPSYQCETWYANRPRSSVHTQYLTGTLYQNGGSTFISTTYTNPNYTVTVYPSTVSTTTTITHKFTSYSTVAATTITKAAEKGFIPLTSVLFTPHSSPARDRRQAEATDAAASTKSIASYPLQVFCSTYYSPINTRTYYESSVFNTHSVTHHEPTPSTTLFTRDVYLKITTTVTVATATAIAECQDTKNVLSSFKGNPIYQANPEYLEFAQVGDVPGNNDIVRAALQSPEACCVAAYANGFSGFYYSGTFGRNSSCQAPVWDSYTGRGYSFFTNNNGQVHAPEDTIWLGNLGPNDVETYWNGNCKYNDPYYSCWTEGYS